MSIKIRKMNQFRTVLAQTESKYNRASHYSHKLASLIPKKCGIKLTMGGKYSN